MEPEAREHVAAGDQQEEGFERRPPLHADQRLDALVVDRGAEAVDRLRGIREHAAPCRWAIESRSEAAISSGDQNGTAVGAAITPGGYSAPRRARNRRRP
jgi:hypothetical protein